MALTALEIKDKTFGVKFRGYDANEVEEFLDIVVRDYEDLVRLNHDQEAKIQALEERLNYFDEMKDSLSQSVLIAQDTAERVKSTIESQLSIIDTPEWDEILRPTAMYIQTSDEAFREIVEKALGESVHHHHAEDENIDLTRQFSPAEIEELQKRIEAANLELGATQAFEGLNEKVQSALEEAEHARHENEEVVAVEEAVQPEDDANRESVNIL